MDERKNPWTIRETTQVYSNPWIEVEHHEVLTPSGNPGIYGTVHFKNLALGIVPLDEAMNTWLVGQYRFPIQKYSWEIPEGGGAIGTDPLQSAQRELMEEVGIKAESWQEVLRMYTSNSVSDELAIAYLARKLQFHAPAPDETEMLETRKLPFEEVVAMALEGMITDAFSVATIFKVKILLDRGLL